MRQCAWRLVLNNGGPACTQAPLSGSSGLGVIRPPLPILRIILDALYPISRMRTEPWRLGIEIHGRYLAFLLPLNEVFTVT